MAEFFSKSLFDISPEDVANLRGTPEGQTFEIKGDLPAENRTKPDSWLKDPAQGALRRGPDDYAKEGIFREIVAFANAEGGWLLIGVKETNDKPKRADSIAPLPACHELADRLQRAADDWLDPPVPGLHFNGIPTEADGRGVVVARVPRSPIAPHRLGVKRTQEAYKRVGAETKPMAMREIQDMTLERSRSQSYVEEAFERARRGYLDVHEGTNYTYVGYQIVAVPTAGPLAIDRPYMDQKLFERDSTLTYNLGRFSGGIHILEHNLQNDMALDRVVPILRGGRRKWLTRYGIEGEDPNAGVFTRQLKGN